MLQTGRKVQCSYFVLNKRIAVVKVQAIYICLSLSNVMSAMFKVLW